MRTVRNTSDQAILRIGATLGVPDVLRELRTGPSENALLPEFNSTLFGSPDNRISLSARGRLLERCVKITGCPYFGLLVGSRSRLESLGLVGVLAKHSPDVGSALRNLCRHFFLHADGVSLQLHVDGGAATLSYRITEPRIPGVDQTGDGAVAAMLNVMRDLCGNDFKAIEARFAHGRPKILEPYKKILGVHLEFDAENYGLVFSVTWLSRPLPPTESALARLILDKVAEQERAHARSFPDQVQAVMRTAVTFDHARADRLAKLFDMHVRTFHRRLAEHGVSHQELLDKTRFEVACELLERTSQKLPQIADILGYAELRSFIRAFKRWSGITPSEWRKRRSIVEH